MSILLFIPAGFKVPDSCVEGGLDIPPTPLRKEKKGTSILSSLWLDADCWDWIIYANTICEI